MAKAARSMMLNKEQSKILGLRSYDMDWKVVPSQQSSLGVSLHNI